MSAEEPGCSDGGCCLRDNRKRQHTNGSCNCLRGLSPAVRVVVRRRLTEWLRAEAPPEAGRISAHTREQIAAAEKACAEGKCERVGEGCVAGHVAADVLAAFDAVGPAVLEVMREMMARKRRAMDEYDAADDAARERWLDGVATGITAALEHLRKALDLPCDWDQS